MAAERRMPRCRSSTSVTCTPMDTTGFSDDQLFELVIAAAVGQSTRMYDSALAALDEATAG